MKTPTWPTFLSFHGTTDGIFRAIAVTLAAVIIVKYSTLFEEEYTKKLTDLYIHPWWRILIVMLVLTSAIWCPRVGILVSLIVFFYLSDMNTLITPFSEL
jgi:FtsH-binding integral membrane protein